jgi:membrane-bound lytic murein transglycosylase D
MNGTAKASRPLLFVFCIFVAYRASASQDIDPAIYLRYPEVQVYVDYFTSGEMKDWLESVLARGSIYSGYITDRIEEFSLPPVLKYLPVIESGYNPRAVSPSGAAGLWQFMMNSIAPYDLLVDEWIDERRDFMKSTVASLRKLTYNNAVLGDWLLAIAAYNCGLNRLKKAIEESGIHDFWELSKRGYLPVETERYIPKFLAVAYIANNADVFNVVLPDDTDVTWELVSLEGQVNLRLLTKHTGVPAKLLAQGNAELQYDVTPPGEYRYYLKVPDIYSDVINRFLGGEIHTLERYRIHTITPGDTLSALSSNYGVSIDRILYHNPGTHPHFLQINSALIIPALYNGYPSAPVSSASHQFPLAHRGRRNNLPIHIVEEGDTLWDIARKYSTTVNELLGVNEISSNMPIKPGQVLHIPVEEGEILTR